MGRFCSKKIKMVKFIKNISYYSLKNNVCVTKKFMLHVMDTNIKNQQKRYETMLILRSDMMDEERDRQLAKFEALLANEGANEIECTVKGRQRMSYPMKDNWDGIYVLFHFNAPPPVAKIVQNVLSNPDAETQTNILRWANFKLE